MLHTTASLEAHGTVSSDAPGTSAGGRGMLCEPVTDLAAPADLLSAVMECLPHGVAVVDANAHLSYWNGAGRARLMAAGWSLRDGRLHAPRCAATKPWEQALRETCTRGLSRLVRMSCVEPVTHVALVPVTMPSAVVNAAADAGLALLLPGREALCGPLEMALFGSSSGLTMVESRVLERLMHGQRPAQIAREHGVAISTVRTQVAAVLAKTQSDSMMGLLSRVARLPALLSLGAGRSH
jgi:DNA-binding CsgD family transcriptional regulator